ncbi:MAG: peptidoglycan-binding protein, partial [Rhodospirillales bacterium]|nr:peptidoglycan-binding protein [Rhodospirillales bacterium]
MFDSSDFFITGDVGSGQGQSRPHDVVRIRRALNETGHGRSPDTPSERYDKSIHDNIIGFQDDFGLEQDG